jgi:hypothetical protein
VQWKEVRKSADYCLLGNDVWKRGFEWFCDWIEVEHPTASIAFAIYNPLNLPIAFFKFLARNDPRYFPTLEIIVVDSTRESLSGLFGRVEWDGTTKPTTLHDVFSPGLGGLEAFFFAAHVGDNWHFDSELMQRHGLYYALAIAEQDSKGFRATPIEIVDHEPSLRSREKDSFGKTLGDFIEDNRDYMHELVSWIDTYQLGL